MSNQKVFISYTHNDNLPFGGQWISLFDEMLQNRLKQLLRRDEKFEIWRDPKLQGNDVLTEALQEQLEDATVFVSVVSPQYLASTWCLRELKTFVEAAENSTGLHVGTKSRVFKVVKTPVELDALPPPLDDLLDYKFFSEGADGSAREFLLHESEQVQRQFYVRLETLAQNIRAMFAELAEAPSGFAVESEPFRTVYLAAVGAELDVARAIAEHELERRSYRVLPQRQLRSVAVEETIRAELARCSHSVHLVGGDVPQDSVQRLELDLASTAASAGELKQLIWVDDSIGGHGSGDALVAERAGDRVEVVRASVHGFLRHVIDQIDVGASRAQAVSPPRTAIPTAVIPRAERAVARSQPLPPPPLPPPSSSPPLSSGPPAAAPGPSWPTPSLPAPAAPTLPAVPPAGVQRRVYLVHDEVDIESATTLRRALEELDHVVAVPLGEGTPTERRADHETEMTLCDAVLIHYGNVSQAWLKTKLQDLVKARAWGRGPTPYVATGVWLAPPSNAHKLDFGTREVDLVLDGLDGLDGSTLQPFIERLVATA